MKSNKTLIAAIALLGSVTLAQADTFALAPAGQGPIDGPVVQGSSVSREQIRSQVAQARLNGQLIPAGQGPVGNPRSTATVLARADVRTDTLQARQADVLIPAGQGPIDTTTAARGTTATPVAALRNGRAVRAD